MKPKRSSDSKKIMNKLIRAVRAREFLWSAQYRGNRYKLERYWSDVAAEVGISSAKCKKKWKNLKDQCRKEIKKNPTSSDWSHFRKLKFIHNQLISEDELDVSRLSLNENEEMPSRNEPTRPNVVRNKRRTIDVDTRRLIQMVRLRELIWNRSMQGHHNAYKLNQCWRAIAEELECTKEEARLKWKYIRDQARKEMRKEHSEWNLLSRLRFLTNQFNAVEPDDDFDLGFLDDPMEESPESPIPELRASPVDDDYNFAPIINDLDLYKDLDDEPQIISSSDEDESFFTESIIPQIKTLEPAKKMRLRMKIQELVNETVHET